MRNIAGWLPKLLFAAVFFSLPLADCAFAQAPVGCDKLSEMPVADYSTQPQNLTLLKQQLLIYRCKRYDDEIGLVIQEAEAWIRERGPQVSNPAIVLDVDETALSNWTRIFQDEYYPFPSACSFSPQKCTDRDWQWSEQAPATEAVLNLYKVAQCIDVAQPCTMVDVYFVTGRREGDKYVPSAVCDPSKVQCDSSMKTPREWTISNLRKAGFSGVTDDHLYMRPKNSTGPVSSYKTEKRIAIEKLGKTIIANVGDQTSDLVGIHAERTFKLPNPFYFIP
jgi:acid phosphatase